jgi:hypothetical protein
MKSSAFELTACAARRPGGSLFRFREEGKQLLRNEIWRIVNYPVRGPRHDFDLQSLDSFIQSNPACSSAHCALAP